MGWYDPHPAQDGNKHIGLNFERIKYWLAVGAQPTERVTYLLARAGLIPPPPLRPSMKRVPGTGGGGSGGGDSGSGGGGGAKS